MKSRKMLIKLYQSELHMHNRHVRPILWTQTKLYARNAGDSFGDAFGRNQKKISEDDKPMFLRMKEKAKNLWKGSEGGQKTEPEDDDPNNFENQLREEQDLIRQDEIAKKDAAVQKARLKSKLFYSDRNLLHNKMPQAGIEWQKNDRQQSKEFQSMMLARFGKATQFNPSAAWPTSDDIQLKKEYEHVLYDGLTLKEMISNAKQEVLDKENAIMSREIELSKKLEKHDEEIDKWRRRVEGKQQFSIREQERTQLLLTELREEFGYDINMNDPQFAGKIAEKEKEIAKRIKEEKKEKSKKKKDEWDAKKEAASTKESEVSSK